MPHDETANPGIAEWFERVDEDLRLANLILSDEDPILRGALFHLQQATEKALKAFLVHRGSKFRRTHSLEEIGEACVAFDATLNPMIDATIRLTEFATAARYPGPVEIPDLATTREFLSAVRTLVEAVKARTLKP